MEYDKAKEILGKQLELLLERSKFCDDKSLAPITELMINIAVLLQGGR